MPCLRGKMFKLTEGYDVFTHLLSSLWSYSSTHISQGRSIVINRTIVAQLNLDIGNNKEILMLPRYTDKYISSCIPRRRFVQRSLGHFSSHTTVWPQPILKKLVTNTTAASKYIPRRPRIIINWNPPFQTSLHKISKVVFFD